MKIGIIGGGFTGIAAAYFLQKEGHQTTVLEKESFLGGLAGGIKKAVSNPPNNWDWDTEQFYHHWFTNDNFVFDLGKEIGVSHKFIKKQPSSHILYSNKTYALDSPFSLLRFPHLSLVDRIRTGITLARLKYQYNITSSSRFEQITADKYLREHSSQQAYELIWKPLLIGKFAKKYKEVNMRWFWARVHKRTPSLVYYKGGFSAFIYDIANATQNIGGTIVANTSVKTIKKEDQCFTIDYTENEIMKKLTVDKVIVTTQPHTLPLLYNDLPNDYREQLKQHEGVGALALVLRLHHPIMRNTYWLSVNNTNWPFLALVEHTNFVSRKNYNGEHIVYIGDYLEKEHPNMKKSKDELIEMFTPYIKRINPLFSCESIIDAYLFKSGYAQPIPKIEHEKNILPMRTPVEGLYLASMAQVYPWDRGTNYSIEMAKRLTNIISRQD